MSLHSRLTRLERAAGEPGRCLGCSFSPGSVRFVQVCQTGQEPAAMLPLPPALVCPVCGRPIRVVIIDADGQAEPAYGDDPEAFHAHYAALQGGL
jgi:hypothetical protein